MYIHWIMSSKGKVDNWILLDKKNLFDWVMYRQVRQDMVHNSIVLDIHWVMNVKLYKDVVDGTSPRGLFRETSVGDIFLRDSVLNEQNARRFMKMGVGFNWR